MAAGEVLENYVNVIPDLLTLTDINTKYKTEDYPLLVEKVPKDYEIPDTTDLPGRVAILLEKPRTVSYVLIRVCSFFDEEEKILQKGSQYVEERNKYVGKEYLLPTNLSSNLKLVNKPGRHSRYVSITQVIEDLPRLIKIQQETNCELKANNSKATIPAGSILEVKAIETPRQLTPRHLICEASGISYVLREDTPINCMAVDDNQSYTVNDIVSSMLLPKTVQFIDVWPESVLLKDDEQAHLLSVLVSGPLKILKCCQRNVFVTWLKKEEHCSEVIALITEEQWKNQIMKVLNVSDRLRKETYIRRTFGEKTDAFFVKNGLYSMRPLENDVIFLLVPKKKKPDLMNYENVSVDQSTEADDDGYEEPVPAVPPRETIPLIPPREPRRRHSSTGDIKLPSAKPRKEDILFKIKEKAKLGFDRVHEQLLRKVKARDARMAKVRQKQRPVARSVSEPPNQPSRICTQEDEKQSNNPALESAQTKEHDKSSKVNLNRPLPELPSVSVCQHNRTDDDKLDLYEIPDEKLDPYDKVKADCEADETYIDMEEGISKLEIYGSKTDTLSTLPDCYKISRQNQTKEHFYEYTVEELAECLKLCGLDKFATTCYEHKLDGGFFKNYDLNSLQDGPFSLTKMEVVKMKKVVEDGWRPKLEKKKAELYFV